MPPTPQIQVKPAAPDTSAAVPATDPVITIDGICPPTPRKAGAAAAAAKTPPAPCKTVVTKAEFEKMTEAGAIAPTMRRNFAQFYVELLVFSREAQKAGIDKDPKFQEFMRLMRMRTMGEFYRRQLDEKYRNPPQQELETYYKQNLPKYEEIKLTRIFIPAKNTSSPGNSEWEKKAADLAKDIHDRAAKGEEFDKLQKEAYTTLSLTIAPPNTSVGSRRRGMMAPKEEQELFGLKAGEVSQVEQDPSGYIIYKVESKQTLPLENVKEEISREIYRQKMEEKIKSVQASVKPEFNAQYFGVPPQAPQAGGGRPTGQIPVQPSPARSTAPPPSQAPPQPANTPATPPPVPQGQKPPQ